MAILTQKKNYKPGSWATAAVVNDTIETAIDSQKRAAQAEASANNSANYFISKTLDNPAAVWYHEKAQAGLSALALSDVCFGKAL